MGRETFRTDGKILTDISKNTSPNVYAEDIISKQVSDAVSKHVTESTKYLISNLRGRIRKLSDGKRRRRRTGEAKTKEYNKAWPSNKKGQFLLVLLRLIRSAAK